MLGGGLLVHILGSGNSSCCYRASGVQEKRMGMICIGKATHERPTCSEMEKLATK